MDRLGYCLGDCSGAPVLASTSFGVTKVVRELPYFQANNVSLNFI
jgi:hypothetical protein